MAKTETEAPVTPLRVGAKAQKLIAGLNKPQAEVDKGVAAAEEMARTRGDRILRDYYLYLALGIDMPAGVKKQWEYFDKNGKEMPGATAKPGAKPATAKAANPGNGPTGGKESVKSDPKPSAKPSPGQSKSQPAPSLASAPRSSGLPSRTESGSTEKSEPGTEKKPEPAEPTGNAPKSGLAS